MTHSASTFTVYRTHLERYAPGYTFGALARGRGRGAANTSASSSSKSSGINRFDGLTRALGWLHAEQAGSAPSFSRVQPEHVHEPTAARFAMRGAGSSPHASHAFWAARFSSVHFVHVQVPAADGCAVVDVARAALRACAFGAAAWPPARAAFLVSTPPLRSMFCAAVRSSSLAWPVRSTAKQRLCTAFSCEASMSARLASSPCILMARTHNDFCD